MFKSNLFGYLGSLFVVFFILSQLNPDILAQSVTGNLEGRITDTTGSPLAGVNILLQSESLQGARGTATSHDGYFRFLSLPTGIFSIKVSSVGFRPLLISKVSVSLGKTTNIGVLHLKQEAVSLPEITVSGEKPIIDPVSTTYGGNIRAASFEQLPTERDYADIATLLPQTNVSYYYRDKANIGGATGYGNKYFVDGVEVTVPLTGIGSTKLPYNFIKEIEVKTGGYGVENRAALGGLINVVTYSGTNKFHGSVFGFYTGNQLTQNQKLGLISVTEGNFSNYDFGFGLGGPIIFDRLWFYAAYNPTFNRRDVDLPGFGTYVDKTLTNSLASKLTWKASDNLNIILTITGDPTQRDAVGYLINAPPADLDNPDPFLQDVVEGGANYSVNGTYTIGKNILVQGLIARIDRHFSNQGATERARNEFLFIDAFTGTWSGGVGTVRDGYDHSTIGSASGTFLLGRHSINAGIEYKTNSVNGMYENHRIVRTSNPANVSDTIFIRYIDNGFGKVSNRIPSVFIRDEWRIFHRLNLSAGIRWEAHSIIGSDGELAQSVDVPLQPRIGFVFLPDENGDNRIFGSFGRFAQEFALAQSANYHIGNGGYYVTIFEHDPRIDTTGGLPYINTPNVIRPEVKGLQAQYYDEFSIGYERLLGWSVKAGVQGIYRTLRQAIDDVWLPEEGHYQYGNPGSGILSEWPKPRHDYTALIFSIERSGDAHFNFLVSYVLSRNYGNYEGLYDALYHSELPNANIMFDDLATARINTTGLLPNDRTHVFKFSGSYSWSFGLSTGISFFAQSGTPLSELANLSPGTEYLLPRGSAGRTPAIWDLNARIMYNLNLISTWHTKLILDLFHIASQRKAVDINQRKYLGVDENGNPINPNPIYGQAYTFQPPFSVRLGMEVNF
jgi:hypothetical protein